MKNFDDVKLSVKYEDYVDECGGVDYVIESWFKNMIALCKVVERATEADYDWMEKCVKSWFAVVGGDDHNKEFNQHLSFDQLKALFNGLLTTCSTPENLDVEWVFNAIMIKFEPDHYTL